MTIFKKGKTLTHHGIKARYISHLPLYNSVKKYYYIDKNMVSICLTYRHHIEK